MANGSESLINVVIHNKLKMLTSLTKRYVVGSEARSSSDADNKPPLERCTERLSRDTLKT